jgi:GntR family transcriptional regulator
MLRALLWLPLTSPTAVRLGPLRLGRRRGVARVEARRLCTGRATISCGAGSRRAGGVWATSCLPSRNWLPEFSASIVTIRQALALLEADGVVLRQQGMGTTVVRDLTRSRWVLLPVTLKQLVETIDTIKPRVLNVRHGASLPEVPIQADEHAALAYVRMRRLHMQDDKPYCLIDLALDERIYRKRPAKYEQYRVLSIMSEAGALDGVQGRQQRTIRSAEVDEAHRLLIEPGIRWT